MILSALGGAVSVPIGYFGNLLKAVPVLPFGSSQIISGVHVLWILLAGILVKKPGSSIVTGILKGLVEISLLSVHSFNVLLISTVEGSVMELALASLGRSRRLSLALAGGFSSSSNVVVLWLTVLQSMPPLVIIFMYIISFASGVLIAGYLGARVSDIPSVPGFLG